MTSSSLTVGSHVRISHAKHGNRIEKLQCFLPSHTSITHELVTTGISHRHRLTMNMRALEKVQDIDRSDGAAGTADVPTRATRGGSPRKLQTSHGSHRHGHAWGCSGQPSDARPNNHTHYSTMFTRTQVVLSCKEADRMAQQGHKHPGWLFATGPSANARGPPTWVCTSDESHE